MKKRFLLGGMLLILFLPFLALGRIGVGVGTGKIEIDQPMKAGLIYNLPSVVVLNTGDEPSEYSITIQHRENQTQLRPSKDWFEFEPLNFYLEPGQTQLVDIKLTLPVKGVQPGDYFAFLQAFPVKKTEVSGTSIGVAAASKLYFSVAPANIFVGLYYRLTSLFTIYSPWSYVVLMIVLATIVGLLFKKFFKFKLKLSIDKK